MDLSIIIVNWNSTEYLYACLSSIYKSLNGITFEIIVIDSASFDGCGSMLRENCPKVKFIQSFENLGFGKANNEAFNLSRGKEILFLNPDTLITGNAIKELYTALRSLPGAGIVGAQLLNSDNSLQTSCISAFPTILNEILDAGTLRRLSPNCRIWGQSELYSLSPDPKPVDVVSGACLMIRRVLFQSIGKFSSEYFMYSEDVDLCYKAQKAGHKVYYVPLARVVHYGGGSVSLNTTNNFSNVLMIESRFRYFKKFRPFAYAYTYRIIFLGVCYIRIAILFLLLKISKNSEKGVVHKNSLSKWIARLRWALGLENWTSKY